MKAFIETVLLELLIGVSIPAIERSGMYITGRRIERISGIPMNSEVLGAMITPAVLISASGVLVLSTSNRVGRTVDRVRALAAEVERLQSSRESASASESKRQHVAEQLTQLSKRAVLLRSAMTALYTAIGLLVGTSILVGLVALLQWQYSSLPVVVGFAGACALLYGSLLLVREARLAVRLTLQEVSFAREAVLRGEQREGQKASSKELPR